MFKVIELIPRRRGKFSEEEKMPTHGYNGMFKDGVFHGEGT